MSNRICIQTNGTQKVRISATNILSCCGYDWQCYGCGGGSPSQAFKYWSQNGVVTGGAFGSKQGCQPYPISSLGNDVPPTPQCLTQCNNTNYNVSYLQDKHFGLYSYGVGNISVQIMYEIMMRGPVQASFAVYQDFFGYKSGVYRHVNGDIMGGHAVRIIGWGTDAGVDYWLVANSWSSAWVRNFILIHSKKFS